MNPMLVDAVVRTMMLLETAKIFEEFDEETLDFLQDLYLWRRTDKFFIDGEPCKFVAGRVIYWKPQQRCLQFDFDNGDIWDASITKLGTRSLIRHCRQLVAQKLAEEDAIYFEEEAA